jgi:5'-3' exonuclease
VTSLYLVDSSIYVFRGWFSLPDSLINQDGHSNNALIGFSDFVYHFLHNEKPRHVVFTFDESLKHSTRKTIYPEYKANRAPAPEDLKRQFQWCRDWVQALGITQVASDRHEADDLVGTLAEIHRSELCNIIILTADKDLAQLIRKDDFWWSFATGQKLNYRALVKKFGVKPEQIADQLALAGDKVDNIPGIPGVGMAIAGRLLTKFETLTNLRENLQQVKLMKFRGSERIMRLLIEHESVLDISSQLTPINCQVDSMKNVQIDKSKVDEEKLMNMMQYHKMGDSRQQKWLQLINSKTI